MAKLGITETDKLKCLTSLKKYLYEDLSNVKEPDRQIIINIALNYFYSGKFDESSNYWTKMYSSSVQELVEGRYVKSSKKYSFDAPTLEIQTREAWKKIKQDIKTLQIKRVKGKIEKTIVFEAPPFHLERINLERDPTTEDFVFYHNYFILNEDAEGTYVSTIKNAFCQENENPSIQEILIKNNCDFFDIIPVPLPINYKLREKWLDNEKNNFSISGKNLIVHLFEWALIDYYIRNKANLIKLIDHKFAIGIQIASSIAIYDYYTKTHCIVYKLDEYSVIPFEEIELSNHELQLTFNICKENVISNRPKGKWLQPYKTCIIGGSNYPDAFLLKNAFDINP